MNDDLFNIEPSEPPLIVTLRKRVEECEIAMNKAAQDYGDTSWQWAEAEMAYDEATRELNKEEARLARLS